MLFYFKLFLIKYFYFCVKFVKPFLAVSEKQIDELLSAFWVMEIDVETPVDQPASLLKSLQRIGFFLL
jgi:hypothetical protein